MYKLKAAIKAFLVVFFCYFICVAILGYLVDWTRDIWKIILGLIFVLIFSSNIRTFYNLIIGKKTWDFRLNDFVSYLLKEAKVAKGKDKELLLEMIRDLMKYKANHNYEYKYQIPYYIDDKNKGEKK